MEEPQKPQKYMRITDSVKCQNHPESIYNTFLKLKSKIESDNPSIQILSEDVVVSNSNYVWKLLLDKDYPNPKYKIQLDTYIKEMEEYQKSL